MRRLTLELSRWGCSCHRDRIPRNRAAVFCILLLLKEFETWSRLVWSRWYSDSKAGELARSCYLLQLRSYLCLFLGPSQSAIKTGFRHWWPWLKCESSISGVAGFFSGCSGPRIRWLPIFGRTGMADYQFIYNVLDLLLESVRYY